MRPLNQQEPPRVVVRVSGWSADRFAFCDELPGTYRFVQDLTQVELTEWDALITDEDYTSWTRTDSGGYRRVRDLPDHLNVFVVVKSGAAMSEMVEGENRVEYSIELAHNVVGHHVYPSGLDLPDGLKRLLKEALQPAIEERKSQFGLMTMASSPMDLMPFGFRPHLLGPRDLVYSADYTRQNKTSVWFVPEDVPDFAPWWAEALRNWHDLQPGIYPGTPDWTQSDEWMTHAELAIRRQIADENEQFAELSDQHASRMRQLGSDLDAAMARAIANEKLLLTGQDLPLQAAVLESLRKLGYNVRDMDLEWPERAPREDYRITDPDAGEDWIAIGDATGVAKGAKGGKIQALAGHTTKFVFEEKPPAMPRQWLLVNRLVSYDPNTRRELFRQDEVGPFAENLGLAFDTVALFLLVRMVEDGSATPAQVRGWLREQTGELLIAHVREWATTLTGTADS